MGLGNDCKVRSIDRGERETDPESRLNHSAVIPVGSVNTTLDASSTTFPLNASVYLDFTHDTSLESSITAMGLLKADYNGNVTVGEIDPNRSWQSALIAPMGGGRKTHHCVLTCRTADCGATQLRILLFQLDLREASAQLGRRPLVHSGRLQALVGRGPRTVRAEQLHRESGICTQRSRLCQLLQQ